MKVLMFGWEFPPHISGGLGTACHGLAHALVDSGVTVLFVVPKLTGPNGNAAVTMINASDVIIPGQKINSGEKATVSYEENKLHHASVNENDTTRETIRPVLSWSPYDNGGYGHEIYSIERWNYQLPGHHSVELPASTVLAIPAKGEPNGAKHQFSGTYGYDLMREVELYSRVAAVIADQHDFDVIHAHDWISFPAGIAAKKVSGKPLVVHVHATEFDRSGDNINRTVYKYELDGMKQADKVLAVSRRTRQTVIDRYNIDPEKVEVVYNGIVARATNPNSDSSPIGSHVVTFLGRVTHQKGPYYFVEAAKLVLEKFPDAHFVVGGSGDLLPAMIEHVADLKMASRFHFTGFIKAENLDRVWSRTDVYVMPSVSEPFGLTPLEAVQSGIPVIISNQSGVAEVITHAIKIDFWDVRMLASAICSILKYKALSDELIQNSEKEIEAINWHSSARKINNFYHELTNAENENDRVVFSNPSAPAA